MLKKIKEYMIISFGAFLVAAGVYFFKFPNNFTTGGVSGLSVIFGTLSTNLTPATFILIINGLILTALNATQAQALPKSGVKPLVSTMGI